MNWLADNWIWLLLVGGFVTMHLVGHRGGAGHGGGCCGGHHSHKGNEGSQSKSADGGCCGGKDGKAPNKADKFLPKGKTLPPGSEGDADFSSPTNI